MRYVSAIVGILVLAIFAQIASATEYTYWGPNADEDNAGDATGWTTSGIWTTDGVTASPTSPGVGDSVNFYSGKLTTLETDNVSVLAINMYTTTDSESRPVLDNEGSLVVQSSFYCASDIGATHGAGKYIQGTSNSSAVSYINDFNGDTDLGISAYYPNVDIESGTVTTSKFVNNYISQLLIEPGAYWNLRENGTISVSEITAYSTISGYVSSGAIYTNYSATVMATNETDYTYVFMEP
jgi:hypothetical protein